MIEIEEILGDEAQDLLGHTCEGVARSDLVLPGPDFVDRVATDSDRSPRVLRNLQAVFEHGRLAGTGYLSILPVDQGVEHSAAASFAPNPRYFDPRHIVELAVEGGCNAVASSLGVLGATSRRFAHRIPFIVKLNHNELLTHPTRYDQIMFASVEHDGVDYSLSADLTGQANHLGATIEADLVKQKQPENNGGFTAIGFGRTDPRVYDELTTDHPIDLTRWQVLNCFAGRAGLINSGGASAGDGDLAQAIRTAVINKRAGGTGLITGRKAFQRPTADGIALLHAVQDVYLDDRVTVA